MKLWACAVAVVSLALAGCGSSVCESLASAVDSLDEKVKPCGLTGSTPITDDEIKQCDKDVDASCTSGDKSELHDYASCIKDVPACSSGNTDPFTTALDACDAKLNSKLTPACSAAAGTESLTRKTASLRMSR